jgi:mRNA interferase MazF
MKPFEVFIVYISWGNGGKSRPVLAFFMDDNSISVYQITTQYEVKSQIIRTKYFKINDWLQAGLEKQSYVDTGTLISLPMTVINGKKPIGELSTEDKQSLLEFLTNQLPF